MFKYNSFNNNVTLSFRLISDRGLPSLRTMFDNVHFKGKGHEVKNKLQTINCYSFIFLFGTFFLTKRLCVCTRQQTCGC